MNHEGQEDHEEKLKAILLFPVYKHNGCTGTSSVFSVTRWLTPKRREYIIKTGTPSLPFAEQIK